MIITLMNQKGGVGKTTLSFNIYNWLNIKSKCVAIDLDTQANLTSILEAKSCAPAYSLFSENISYENTEFFTANYDLREIEKVNDDITIRQFINNIEKLKKNCQHIIIDTPPSIGVRQVAAIAVSDIIITPLTMSNFDISGIGELNKTIKSTNKRYLNRAYLKIVANKINPMSKIEIGQLEKLKQEYQNFFFNSVLKERRDVKNSTNNKQTIFNNKSKAQTEWVEFLNELCEVIS